MSTLLESLRIPVARGFSPDHVPRECDAVIVGNAALRDNVEAAEAVRRGLPVLSLPQAVRRYLLPGKTAVVIAGTHGKTTTSALTAWLLLDSGRDPGFLVGGEMINLGRGYRGGKGPHVVLEGDEYNAAFFDRGPKFLHYEPKHLLLGNIEYDHADLYPDLPSVVEAFRQVVRIVPEDGVVVANADDKRVARGGGFGALPRRAHVSRGPCSRLLGARRLLPSRAHGVHARRGGAPGRAPRLPPLGRAQRLATCSPPRRSRAASA